MTTEKKNYCDADKPVTVRHAGKSRTFKNMDEMWKEQFGMSDEFIEAGKREYEQARADAEKTNND